MQGMATVRSSFPSHTLDDQVDSDFFDRLANGFGAGDTEHLPDDFRQDERDRLDDTFSKLILGDEDCAPISGPITDALASSPIKEGIDDKTSIESASCRKDDKSHETSGVTESINLADNVLSAGAYPSVELSSHVDECLEASGGLGGSTNLCTESGNCDESQPLVMGVSGCPDLANNNVAAVEVSVENARGNGEEPSGLEDAYAPENGVNTGIPSFETPKAYFSSIEDQDSKEGSHGMLQQNGSFFISEKAPVFGNNQSQLEISAINPIDAPVDQTSQEDCNGHSLPKFDVGDNRGSPGFRELQWSSFGNSCQSDAFGSYSDFFSELGGESLIGSNQQITAPIGGYQAETLADPLVAQNFPGSFGDNFSLHPGSSHYSASLEHFDESASWNQQGALNVGVVEQEKFVSAGFVTNLSEMQHEIGSRQSGFGNDEVGSFNDMPRSVNYEVQLQEQAQQSWENMYPGWQFDYASNEWKQIEGWSVEQSQHVTRDSGDPNFTHFSESSQSFTMASNLSWQYDQGQNFLSNEGLVYGLNTETYVADDNKQAASSSLPAHPTNWEQQYPGWYFNNQTQQWCQIADDNQHWGSNQDTKVLEASDNVEPVQSLQSSGGGWIDQQGEPHYQNEVNQSIYAPAEGNHTLSSNSEHRNMNTLGRGMSFNSWAGSTTNGLGFSEQSVDSFTSGDSVSQWTGFQGSHTHASHHAYQAMTDSVNDFQQDPTLSEKQSFIGSTNGFFQSHLTNSVRPEYSSAGRPPHALVAFGFGGKLVTMKTSILGNVEPVLLHDLNHLVSHGESQNDETSYFSALNRLGLSGPLQGFSSKEVLRWIDERIESCGKKDSQGMNSDRLDVLWGVLKIACQHYGRLRSVAGSSGIKSQMEEGPEVALGRLLRTTKSHSHWNQGLATSADVPYSFPAGNLLQAAVNEMTNQLMDGKMKEALQIAQQGQLWGLALVLAWQLGEKVYADTVLQMARKQFSLGSPMRTLLLLFAGQASELFKVQSLSVPAGNHGSFTISSSNTQDSAGGMLSDWLGNLSIIAANPTKGDEKVIMHLGDSLWKDQGEVSGAHICYLVAGASFESFSKEARLCLVGADHFKFQRTFVTPQAIQRTEVYEYAKTLGNPQYVLVSFQPFKLLYAHMLAEAGRITEAIRYCQMVIKNLKNAGRNSEIDFCKQSAVALEERLRLHSQGGYGLNLSTGNLVGKVMGTIDSTIHKIIGGPPVPQQATPFFRSPWERHASDRNVSSAMKAAPIMPSASNNSLSSVNSQVDVPPRSLSEPNLIGSSTLEPNAESSSMISSTSPPPSQLKAGDVNGGGYLGRFGRQFFAKAIGLMRHSKEAKLGDENKFYYDEKLKRWVEAGAEQSTEEAALPPPPIVAGFNSSSGSSEVNYGRESQDSSARVSSSADLPPIPHSTNHFSARGRLDGVRSRYVDTIHKGNAQVAARPSPLPVVPAGVLAVAGSPSQFFPSASFTETSGSLDKFASGQNDYGSLDLQTPPLDNAKTGHMLVESGPLLPKNLNSSFMDVPLIQKHLSTSNIANKDHSQQVKNDPSYFASMARGAAWSGDSPSVSHQHKLSNGSMADDQTKTFLNAVAPLPSPPIIFETRPSRTGYGSAQMQTLTAEGMFSGSLQGVAFEEMREVEL